MSNILGEQLQLWVGSGSSAHTIACATNLSVDISSDSISTDCKDSGPYASSKRGKISWEITSDNLFTTTQYSELYGYMISGTSLNVVFSEVSNYDVTAEADNDGHIVPEGGWQPTSTAKYTGKGEITKLSLSANNGEIATYNVTITGKGPLSLVTQ